MQTLHVSFDSLLLKSSATVRRSESCSANASAHQSLNPYFLYEVLGHQQGCSRSEIFCIFLIFESIEKKFKIKLSVEFNSCFPKVAVKL